MKVIFIHKPTGYYVGGSVFNKTCGFYKCRDKMIEKGIREDKANMLIDIIGPYACIWEVENGDDPYESMRSRLKDKASYLDGEDLIMENYDDEEDEEDGEID